MADITLLDGRELTVDLRQIKRRDYVRLVDNQLSDEDACAIMAGAVGLSKDEVLALAMMDWRRVFLGIVGKGLEPLADPNSASASS